MAAQSGPELKASFIRYLLDFIEWPSGAPGRTICVHGSNTVTGALSVLLETDGYPQPVAMATPTSSQSQDQLEQCDALLWVRGSLDAAAEIPLMPGLLTVSDADGFIERGGMIELERRPDRVGLVLNERQLKRAGFVVSSKVLALPQVTVR